jgi:hypothetical protein
MGETEAMVNLRRSLLGAGVLLFGATLSYSACHMHSVRSAAREQVMPACIEQLGEEACRAHIAQNDVECMSWTTQTRGAMRVDTEGYLRCVVLGVDGWFAEREARRKWDAEQQAKANREAKILAR